MIIPAHEEMVHLTARNVSTTAAHARVSASGRCSSSVCVAFEVILGFFAIFLHILGLFLNAYIHMWKALSEGRPAATFLTWCFTFAGVAFTLQRRGVRMSNAKAAELRAFFRARGFGWMIPNRHFFAKRRKLSLSAAMWAWLAATAMAWIVWEVGGLLGL